MKLEVIWLISTCICWLNRILVVISCVWKWIYFFAAKMLRKYNFLLKLMSPKNFRGCWTNLCKCCMRVNISDRQFNIEDLWQFLPFISQARLEFFVTRLALFLPGVNYVHSEVLKSFKFFFFFFFFLLFSFLCGAFISMAFWWKSLLNDFWRT